MKTQETTQATQEAQKVSLYTEMVINSNKAIKTHCKSLGYALTVIINTEGTNDKIKKVAKAIKKDSVLYEEFKKNVRVTKTGKFVPFYCLQAIYKGLNK